VLPDVLCQRLREALTSLDSERISAVIGETEETDVILSRNLSQLAENFEYPAILAALNAAMSGHTPSEEQRSAGTRALRHGSLI
jgi:hypothetical protein